MWAANRDSSRTDEGSGTWVLYGSGAPSPAAVPADDQQGVLARFFSSIGSRRRHARGRSRCWTAGCARTGSGTSRGAVPAVGGGRSARTRGGRYGHRERCCCRSPEDVARRLARRPARCLVSTRSTNCGPRRTPKQKLRVGGSADRAVRRPLAGRRPGSQGRWGLLRCARSVSEACAQIDLVAAEPMAEGSR